MPQVWVFSVGAFGSSEIQGKGSLTQLRFRLRCLPRAPPSQVTAKEKEKRPPPQSKAAGS